MTDARTDSQHQQQALNGYREAGRCGACGSSLPGTGGIAMQAECITCKSRVVAQADAKKNPKLDSKGLGAAAPKIPDAGPSLDATVGNRKQNNQSDDGDDDDDDAPAKKGDKAKAMLADPYPGNVVPMRPSSKDFLGG